MRMTAPTLDELRDQIAAVLAELDVLAAMLAASATAALPLDN
jgi:hypothetical protein